MGIFMDACIDAKSGPETLDKKIYAFGGIEVVGWGFISGFRFLFGDPQTPAIRYLLDNQIPSLIAAGLVGWIFIFCARFVIYLFKHSKLASEIIAAILLTLLFFVSFLWHRENEQNHGLRNQLDTIRPLLISLGESNELLQKRIKRIKYLIENMDKFNIEFDTFANMVGNVVDVQENYTIPPMVLIKQHFYEKSLENLLVGMIKRDFGENSLDISGENVPIGQNIKELAKYNTQIATYVEDWRHLVAVKQALMKARLLYKNEIFSELSRN